MIISHNLLAMNANRQFNITNKNKAKSTEKLSSGYRINRAADDVAGLSISEKMRWQIRGLSRGVRNTEDGVSLCQVADGALAEVSEMLHRITELSVQSANGTNTDENRKAIQQEISQIKQEIERIGDTTEFNGKKLFYDSETKIKSEIKEQFLSHSISYFTSDVVLASGEIIGKDAANDLVSALGAYMTSVDLLNCSFRYPQDKSEMINKFQAIESYAAKFKGRGLTTYDNKMNSGKNNVISALNGGSGFLLHEASGYYNTAGRDANSNGYTAEEYIAFGMEEVVNAYMKVDPVLSDGVSGGTYTGYAKWAAGLFGDAAQQIVINAGINSDKLRSICDQIGSNYGFPPRYISENDALEAYLRLCNHKKDGPIWIQSGSQAGQGMFLEIDRMDTNILGINDLDSSTVDGANHAIDAAERALEKISSNRSKIGAQQNRLEHTIANEQNVVENTTSAESRIRDTDMAKEMVEFSKGMILENVGQAMLAQANKSNQNVLSLL